MRYLATLKPENQFTSEDYKAFFNDEIKERTARIDIQKLVEGAWLMKTGDGAQTKYYKTNKKMPDNAGQN